MRIIRDICPNRWARARTYSTIPVKMKHRFGLHDDMAMLSFDRIIDCSVSPIKEASVNFEDLKNAELQEELRSLKTSDELVAFVKAGGMELSDEQIDAISGGGSWNSSCDFEDNEWWG